MRKPAIYLCENKGAISCTVTVQLISAVVIATKTVQYLYFLNLNFQASKNLLWPYSQACVGPGRKLQRQVFLPEGSVYVW